MLVHGARLIECADLFQVGLQYMGNLEEAYSAYALQTFDLVGQSDVITTAQSRQCSKICHTILAAFWTLYLRKMRMSCISSWHGVQVIRQHTMRYT